MTRLALVCPSLLPFEVVWDNEMADLVHSSLDQSNAINSTFAFRILCNLFVSSRASCIRFDALLGSLASFTSENRNLRQAYVTFLSK